MSENIAQTLNDHMYRGSCPDGVNGWDVRDPECSACRALDALAVQGEPEQEWQYGREAVFVKDGTRYDDDLRFESRSQAEGNIRICNENEKDEPFDIRAHYYLVRRRVVKPGPWLPVEENGESE